MFLRGGFQFPSNGKAHSDSERNTEEEVYMRVSIPFKREGTFRLDPDELVKEDLKVSIPFKREGTFRQYPPKKKHVTLSSFNSLQTGRHIQTSHIDLTTPMTHMCFNSLQTGRHIQTVAANIFARNAESFNSLQTGRHIQTNWDELEF